MVVWKAGASESEPQPPVEASSGLQQASSLGAGSALAVGVQQASAAGAAAQQDSWAGAGAQQDSVSAAGEQQDSVWAAGSGVQREPDMSASEAGPQQAA